MALNLFETRKIRKADIYIKNGILEKYRYNDQMVIKKGERLNYRVGNHLKQEDIKLLIDLARFEGDLYTIIEEDGNIMEYNPK